MSLSQDNNNWDRYIHSTYLSHSCFISKLLLPIDVYHIRSRHCGSLGGNKIQDTVCVMSLELIVLMLFWLRNSMYRRRIGGTGILINRTSGRLFLFNFLYICNSSTNKRQTKMLLVRSDKWLEQLRTFHNIRWFSHLHDY